MACPPRFVGRKIKARVDKNDKSRKTRGVTGGSKDDGGVDPTKIKSTANG